MSDDQTTQIREAIQSAIAENPVILFMKGTPDQPMCGFSARTVAILQSVGTPFAAVNILPDPRIRQELSALSNWPTIPQLFIDGEFVGGCDIVTEMYESGELQTRSASRTRTTASQRPNRGAGARAADDRKPPLGLDHNTSVVRPVISSDRSRNTRRLA